jgi:hypothetical protein
MKIITTRKKCKVKKCKGELLYSGGSFSNFQGTFHNNKCNKCDKEYVLEKAYPIETIEYLNSELETRWEK